MTAVYVRMRDDKWENYLGDDYVDKAEEVKIKLLLKQWGSNMALYITNQKEQYDLAKAAMDEINNSGGAAMVECYALAEAMWHSIRERIHLEKNINDSFDSLDSLERRIIELRYKKNIKWDFLPVYMPCGISVRQCQRIHNQALEKIAMYLKDNDLK